MDILRDWSLITGRGGLQNGKIAGPKLFAPPPQDRVKLFAPPLLKSGNFSRPPYNMAKTSSYCVKTTLKLFVPPPSAWLKLFPPPFFVGVKLHVPPLPFCSPPLPVIRDWSLITGRGGLQNGKIAGPKLFAPPPQDRVKLFAPPLLKSGNFSRPPYNMAKTSSYCVKTTLKLFVPPPSAWLKLFPPPFFVGVKLHVPPPSRFVAPPSP